MSSIDLHRRHAGAHLPIRFETLESRLLFSAEPVSVIASIEAEEAVIADSTLVEQTPAPVIDLADRRLLGQAADSPQHELVVIDASVPDADALIAALSLDAQPGRHFDVLLLDARSDGIQQIDAALRVFGSTTDAVHVFAHGLPGGVQLGSTLLNDRTLIEFASGLQQWRTHLNGDADLFVYACSVAAEQTSVSWLDALSQLTGADVAASTDATGATALGGDWDLEFHAGVVDSASALHADSAWQYLLGANQTTSGTQSRPAVATDALGNRIVVWQSDAQDGSGWGIYGRRYDASGAAQGAEFLVNQTTAGDQYDPDVVMDAAGNFIVSWTTLGQDGDGATQGNIYARMFAANGTALGSEFRVNSTSAGDQREAAIGIDSDSEFMVVWSSAGQDGSGWGVYAKKYDADGLALTSEMRINTTTAGDQRSPDVVGDDFGDFIFVWQSAGQDGDGWGIYRTYYANNGAFQGGEKRVNSETDDDQTDPAIGVDIAGNWLITWTSKDQDGSHDGIYANYFRYSGSGGNGTGEFRVNTTVADDQFDSSIGYDAERNFIVVWSSEGQEGDDSDETNIYAQLLENVGSGIDLYGAESRINSGQSGSQEQAAVAMSTDGSYVVVWGGSGAGDTAGIDIRSFTSPFGGTAPSVALANAALTVFEGDAAVGIDTALTIADSDSSTLSGATVQIDSGFEPGEDILQYTAMLGIAGSFDAGAGVLTLTGPATVASYQQALRTVTYRNVAAEPTPGQRRITLTVSDGVHAGSDARNIGVFTVNDAPVLSGVNSLLSILEDAAGDAGTLVSALIAGHMTDADSGASNGIAVVGVDNTHGTWQYSTNAGGSWLAFGSPSVGAARLLAADATTYVRFVPTANWSGTVTSGLTLRAWDRTSGAAGGIGDTSLSGGTSAYSVATFAATIAVTAVNDAPTGADTTLTLTEDGSYTLSATDFGFGDAADSPVDSFAAVRVAALPSAGMLTNDGVAVGIGQYVSRADIDAGKLVYRPATHGNGAGYASVAFQVRDSGDTANGGIDHDAVANTLTFDVTAVNDAPINALPATQYTTFNTALVIGAATVTAIVVTDVDAGLNPVEVTLIAGNGLFTLASTIGLSFVLGDGTADTVMIVDGTLAAINAALDGATFTPTLGFSGTATLVVGTNDLGASGGGSLTDDDTLLIEVAGALALNVVPDAVTVDEDAPLAGVSVLANDSDPVFGSMTVDAVNGVGAAVGVTVTLPSGALLTMNADGSYTYDPNGIYEGLAKDETALDTFTYGSTSTSGRIGTGRVMLTVRGANDAPVLSGTNDLLPICEDAVGGAGTLVASLIAGRVADVDADTPMGIAVTAVDNAQGDWQYSTNGGASWSSFGTPTPTTARLLAADSSTYVRFVPAANWNGTVVGGISFRAWDVSSGAVGGTADASINGGSSAYSISSAAASVVVQAVNDAPAGTDRTVTAVEDADYVFSAADFGFVDGDDASANALDAVRIAALPAAGSLRNAGIDVSVGQFVTRADIDAGHLVYVAARDAHGAAYATFSFQVRDDGGTLLGGVNLDVSANAIVVDVTAVNDAPVFSHIGGAVSAGTEDGVLAIEFSELLSQSDAGDVDGTIDAFIVTSLQSGTLRIGASAATALPYAIGSNDLIDATHVAYWTPDANAWGTLVALHLTARDDASAESVTPVLARVTVSAVNDAPVLSGLASMPTLVSGTANVGASVAALIVGLASDVDTGDALGLAIVSVDETHGAWQYTLDGGASWIDLDAVSEQNALLLAADRGVAVRFVPESDFVGDSSLVARAWDRTSGTAGARADVSVNGGVTAFSAQLGQAHVEVAAAPADNSSAATAFVSEPSRFASAGDAASVDVPRTSTSDSVPLPGHEAAEAIVTPKDAPPSSGRAAPPRAASEAVEPTAETPAPNGDVRTAMPTTFDGGGAPAAAGTQSSPAMVVQPTIVQSLPSGSNAVASPSAVALLGQDFVAQPEKSAATVSSKEMREALDALRESVQSEGAIEGQVAAASAAITGSLSAGYVLWLVRGGVLATSLMSSLPAWRVLDPLPVLANRTRRQDEDDESLESMVDADDHDHDDTLDDMDSDHGATAARNGDRREAMP